FDVSGDTSFHNNLCGPATIHNTFPTRRSSDLGSTAIGPAFNNNGSLLVQSGTVSFYSGGDSRGSFNAAAGATLNFAGGTMTLESNSTLTAAGAVRGRKRVV